MKYRERGPRQGPSRQRLHRCTDEQPDPLYSGDPGIGFDTYGDEIIVSSLSSADTRQQLRTVDSKYMYNLSTKEFKANTNYEIRIRVGSTTVPIITKAHLYPKR